MTKRNIVISIFIATVIAGSAFVPRIALAANCGGAETSVISCEGEGSTAEFLAVFLLSWVRKVFALNR